VARGWSGPGAPTSWRLTAAVFETLADEPELLALAATIPLQRLPPLLFAASVQYLVARHSGEPLAAYYPKPGGPQPPLDEHFPDRFRAFCRAHRDQLAEVWDQRVYQMNEVARCTQVVMALGVLMSGQPGRDVAIVDVGTGSGLGLYLDRYGYRLSDERSFGATDSRVQLGCELEEGLRPPVPRLPPVRYRTGIDVNPIDVRDPDARAWLLACIPPEEGALRRLAAAMDVAQEGDPTIVRGDAAHVLPDVLDAIPEGPLVAVVDTYTAVFLDQEGQRAMGDLIATLGRERDIGWIALDPIVPLGTNADGSVQGFDVPRELIEENRRGGVFAVLSLVAHLGGRTTTHLLATAHPSGTRMRWIDRSSAG